MTQIREQIKVREDAARDVFTTRSITHFSRHIERVRPACGRANERRRGLRNTMGLQLHSPYGLLSWQPSLLHSTSCVLNRFGQTRGEIASALVHKHGRLLPMFPVCFVTHVAGCTIHFFSAPRWEGRRVALLVCGSKGTGGASPPHSDSAFPKFCGRLIFSHVRGWRGFFPCEGTRGGNAVRTLVKEIVVPKSPRSDHSGESIEAREWRWHRIGSNASLIP